MKNRPLIQGFSISALAVVFILWGFFRFLAAQSSTATVIANLENKLKSINSLEADFRQIYMPTAESRGLEEKGHLYLQKPDLMRWDYLSPERKSFLLKGELFLSYFFEDKQVYRQPLTEEEVKGSILGLLSGKANLLELYSAQVLSSLSDDATLVLRLEPHQKGEIEQVLLEIDQRRWLIQKLSFLETTGSRQEFYFSRFQLNRRLPSSTFTIPVPPDWEVIDEAGPTRRKEPRPF